MKKYNVWRIISIVASIFCVSVMLVACGEENLAQGETYADSPLAANAKQAAQQANAKNTKETKASHEYGAIEVDDKNTLVIGEKLFLTQINDIYNNFQRYDGKTIVVEGMLGNYTEWDNSMQNAVVFRNGPGCCGNDGWGGFYLSDMTPKAKGNGEGILYSYDKTGEDIEIDDWIKVTGKPALYEGTDTEGTKHRYLFLEVEKLENHKDK
ncbi:MAG: hypothetical protein MJ151_03705, partial [Lachnospiraceae bacterium]|nr:hypothetical protein [Lachnospiraceae bacterium]